jgi:hypothetical protein
LSRQDAKSAKNRGEREKAKGERGKVKETKELTTEARAIFDCTTQREDIFNRLLELTQLSVFVGVVPWNAPCL